MKRIGSPAPSARGDARRAPREALAAADVLAFVERSAAALARHEALLDRLDATLGDGDHGSNMTIGFAAAVPVARAGLAERPDDVGELLRLLGHSLVASVGGASGPLYGTAFIEAGFALAGQRRASPAELAGALEEGQAGLVRRGRCAVGDKTILDALAPAVQALRAGAEAGDPLDACIAAAAAAAAAGMRSTDPARRPAGPRPAPRRAFARSSGPRRNVLLPDHRRDGARRPGGAPQVTGERRRTSRTRGGRTSSGVASARDDLAALRARVRELEAERRRIFEDAQREADAVFSQYQLSQLLAAGGTVDELAAAVLAEVARASGASGAALWLAAPGSRALDLVALFPGTGEEPVGPGWATVPRRLQDAASAASWAAAGGWSGVALPEGRALGEGAPVPGPGVVGYLAIRADAATTLVPDHDRYLGSVRLELAITLRAAQLRASFTREQATLAAILEGATDAIVAVDRSRRVVRLNAAAAALVQTSASAGTGMRCSEFLGCARPHPDPATAAGAVYEAGPELLCGSRCPFAEVLETGGPIVGREIAVRRRDGGSIPVAASVSRMPTPDGGAVAVIRDLRAAQALDDAKASFVAAVSHELRTPLALIDGYTQSLIHLDLDRSTARRHAQRIADAARRLATLVDDIIDISQLESDALILRRTPVAIEGLIRAYVGERADGLDARSIAVSMPHGLPPVDIDATRIRQVIGNLVQNAEKHAGTHAPVEIRARRHDLATIVVTVADGGRGIAASDRDRVFERFYRGGPARESQVPGSGLGLYLCRRIVEAHGGWIRLDATTRGTSISMGLPVALLAGRETGARSGEHA